MTCNVKNIWVMLMLFSEILKQVNPQYPMPMFGPPMFPMPMFPVPGQIPMMGRAPFSFTSSSEENNNNHKTKTTTATTTKKTKRKIHVAFPIPVPQPMPPPIMPPMPPPIAFPAMPPIICREAPSNTRTTTSTPRYSPSTSFPIPIPMIAPQPLVIVPFPQPPPVFVNPQRRKPRKKLITICSSSSQQSMESSSCESSRSRRKKYRKRKRPNMYRRNLRSSESDNELLKPMLSYVAENGDVKFETKISNDDVAELLSGKPNAKRTHQTVRVMTDTAETSNSQVVVVSNDKDMRRARPDRHKKVFLKGGVSNHVLREGKKELIFRPPDHKKISNLSLSFQIS